MKTFNPSVNQALDSIKQSLANQQRVAFVYHSWMPFHNLSLAGFRFPQIPEKEIPRLSLTPIVQTQATIMGSKLSTRLNRYVPVEIPYPQSISATLQDLRMKFASFGMVELSPLETTIDQIEPAVKIFEVAHRGITSQTPLEVMTEYFGVESEMEYQFSVKRPLLKKSAYDYLDEALQSNELTYGEYETGRELVPILGESIRVSHLNALDPVNGILPKTIRDISQNLKFKFDPVDEWLARQFPSFDARGSLKTARQDSGNELLEKLVDVLAAKIAPEKAEPVQNAVSVDAFSQSPEAAAPAQCAATTASGNQCKGKAVGGTEFCNFHQPKDVN